MSLITRQRVGFSFIILITLTALIALTNLGPISQDKAYHLFKDSRTFIGIPNFWNIFSNIPFLLVGTLGLYKILISDKLRLPADFKNAYTLLFLALCLVAVGSGYYHLSPDNASLMWDRLPMSIGFMSLFVIIIGEFISCRAARVIFIPAIFLGIASVVYWNFTETNGEGDLRFYLIIQFLPVILTPVILTFFKPQYTRTSGYWNLLIAYLAAKLFEYFDVDIFNALEFISGHSLKHLAAALGFYMLLIAYEKRDFIKL